MKRRLSEAAARRASGMHPLQTPRPAPAGVSVASATVRKGVGNTQEMDTLINPATSQASSFSESIRRIPETIPAGTLTEKLLFCLLFCGLFSLTLSICLYKSNYHDPSHSLKLTCGQTGLRHIVLVPTTKASTFVRFWPLYRQGDRFL